MSQAAISVMATVRSSIAPLNTIDHTFHIAYHIFKRYRTVFVIVTGTSSSLESLSMFMFGLVLCSLALVGWLYNRLWINRKFFSSIQSMQCKTVVITGGNAGIGYETAKDLLRRGSNRMAWIRSD
jgi:hypothetical protein